MKSLSRQQRALLAELLARNLGSVGPADPNEPYIEFYRRTIPAGYTVPTHIEFICGLVQQVIDGRIMRLAVSTPPGHGKSDAVTRRLPIYWGSRNPTDVIVATGYNQRFAERSLSYPCRELARELGVLSANSTALDEWQFSNGARFVARGVGAAPTGINPISLLIADDPIADRARAASDAERENMWEWWTGSIVQRFWPRTRAIVIATRWHDNDLIGRLKATDDGSWTFVNLPAIAEDDDDPLGRKPGEALWPEMKPVQFLEEQRRAMGEAEFEALFQGNPTPKEGTIFKVSQFQIVDAIPNGLFICRAWDSGATGGGGDYTAGVKMAGPDKDGLYYVVDVVRGQWDTGDRDKMIRLTAQADGPAVSISLPQDPGAAGKSQAAYWTRLLAGFIVSTEPVSGSKVVRAGPFSAQVNAGNVRLLRGAWNGPYIEEHRQFNRGKHDDQVDASSDAFMQLANAYQVETDDKAFAEWRIG